MSTIDPNLLLRNFRSAAEAGHLAMAAMAIATLDQQIVDGGELPDEWKR